MKLKRILAGVTACTIVGSTMLAMPASATTTTAAKDVKIFDVMNAAKTIAQLEVSDDVKASILDRFDTNGNGKIDMTELVAMAQRVARVNETPIVNEYGTADATTTTEATTGETTVETTVSTDETTETTLETTVSTDETTTTEETTSETTEETTTEETTTTTAALEPTVAIGNNEYSDGDTVVVEGTDVYSVSVSDENYDVEVALAGSKDKDGKDAVRVNGTNFVCNSDGKLTITVTVPDTDLKKVITLNVKKVKTIESNVKKLVIGYNSGNGAEYSDEYKSFSEGIQKDIYNSGKTIDPEKADEYWAELEGKAAKFADTNDCNVEGTYSKITVSVGGTATIAGFFDVTKTGDDGKFVKYDTTDTVTYMSTDSNSVDVDANGTITGIKSTITNTISGGVDNPVQVLVIVGGKSVTSFYVTVTEDTSANATVEASGSTYVKDSNHISSNYDYAVEGKYVANVSAGSVPSLNSLKEAVGEENIKSVTFKNADGSAVKDLKVYDNEYTNNVIYFVNSTTGTVYYAITNAKGIGEFSTDHGRVMVLDMEQAKATAVIPEGAITVTINGVKSTSEDEDVNTVYVTEGTTFTLADIAKVQGVTNPTITVENSDKGTDTQNVSYDALTKTFTVNDLTDKNSGKNNEETITFSYKVSEKDTRTVSVKFVTVKPALQANPYEKGFTDINGSTIFVEKTEMTTEKLAGLAKPVYAINADNKDGSTNLENAIEPKEAGKITSSNEKIVAIDEKTGITVDKNYKAEAGDTVTLTYTFEQGQTVSYTIEVVDKLPTVAKNSMVEDTYKYGKDNEGYQANITFAGLVKAYNIPDGAELVVNVESVGTSDNVTYMNGKEQVNDKGYTVSAVDIALESAGNNSYTLTGIEVGAKDKVAADTKITFTVSVVDADGNVISKSANITVYIVGGDEAVPEINLNSAKLTAKDGTDNKVATYQYTPVEGWELQNTAATNIGVEGGTVAVTGNDTITLTLTDPYISETEKTTTATLTFKKGDVIKTKDVTLKYTGVVEDTKDLNIALTNNTAAFDSAEATSVTYTLDTAKMNGWTLKEQTVTLADGTDATVTANGDTITLTFKGAPIEDGSTSPVSLTLTKAGQNEINKEVTLNYTAYQVAP